MAKANLMSDNYLHAYIDGQLSAQQAAEVKDYLRKNTNLLAEFQLFKKINNETHSLYDPILDEAVPEQLSLIVDSSGSVINDVEELLESDRDYFAQWQDNALQAKTNNQASPQQIQAPVNKKPPGSDSGTLSVVSEVAKFAEPFNGVNNLATAKDKSQKNNATKKSESIFDEVAGEFDPIPQAAKPAQISNSAISTKTIVEQVILTPPASTPNFNSQFKPSEPHQKRHHLRHKMGDFNLPGDLDKLIEKDINLLEQKAKILGQKPAQYKEFGESAKFKLPDFLSSSKPNGLNRPTIVGIWIVMCVALGWLLFSFFTRPSTSESEMLTRYAVDAHRVYSREAAYAVEMDGTNKEELANWLSSRLDSAVKPADLNSVGYQLMGGRLLPALGRNSAFFMYKNNNNERITVFISNISKNEIDSGFNCEFTNKTSVCSWLSDKLSFRIIGDQPLVELQLIAKIIYQQLPHRAS